MKNLRAGKKQNRPIQKPAAAIKKMQPEGCGKNKNA
jgi:hypothetical protein